ncbi:MAG: hypothetical protein AAF676_10430 [Pseudomonadota bacterium]
MRRSTRRLLGAAALGLSAVAAQPAAAQPADMEAFDAEEAAHGRASLAWSRPATGLAPGAPLPQTFGPAYGVGPEGSDWVGSGWQGYGWPGSGWAGSGWPGPGWYGGGTVLLGPIIIDPRHRLRGPRPGLGLGQGGRGPGLEPHGGGYRSGYRKGYRQGYRQGLRKALRRSRATQVEKRAIVSAQPWAPGGLYRGGSVHARTGVGAYDRPRRPKGRRGY